MSSVHSRIASARHMARTSSLKGKQGMVSRRWSVIKDMNCINVSGANSLKNVTSLNFLPYKGQDEVIMSGAGSEEHRSEVSSDSSESKMNSIQIAASCKNVESNKNLSSVKSVKKMEEKPQAVLEKLDEV